MATRNYYEGVGHVVQISSDIGENCEHCQERIGLERFAESVNHYLDKHGYKLLHVGTQTGLDADGKPWQSTIAVVGR